MKWLETLRTSSVIVHHALEPRIGLITATVYIMYAHFEVLHSMQAANRLSVVDILYGVKLFH